MEGLITYICHPNLSKNNKGKELAFMATFLRWCLFFKAQQFKKKLKAMQMEMNGTQATEVIKNVFPIS